VLEVIATFSTGFTLVEYSTNIRAKFFNRTSLIEFAFLCRQKPSK
jgi:hypothetical protein